MPLVVSDLALTPDAFLGRLFTASICQNECEVLEFSDYGKNFITRHKFSPDAFVQMAFQAAYYSLYGRTETTYEPAMTKAFLHGRTEAIRTVQPESLDFVKVSELPKVTAPPPSLNATADRVFYAGLLLGRQGRGQTGSASQGLQRAL